MTAPSDLDRGDTAALSDDIVYPAMIPFILVHLACFAAIWTGVYWQDVLLAVGLYIARMFGITGGYHRYFSHRSYKTGRVMQFLLAFLAESSAQRGALWWAAKHRHHHKYSDTPMDVHSPKQKGFFYSHLGWIFTPKHDKADYRGIGDLTKFPELVWLDKHYYVPPIVMGTVVWFLAGWSGLVVGFLWSTVALYHATFCINSLAHVMGRRRYLTGDDSRNNWALAIATLGEGWHNNHHAYQSSVRQGFRWWEVDVSYYIIKAMSWVGLVWDIHEPPASVVRNEQRLGTKVIETAAAQLAASFQVEKLTAQVREALAHTPTLAEIEERVRQASETAKVRVESLVAHIHLPHIPTTDELRQRAAKMFVRTPSMDDIVERARQILIANVCSGLAVKPA
ncbi:acyl-CoA desaturase [Niveispirillum irakense]|uniref:acyl-CoA desaturase n=1 Tax=Niveispirillum irakense TaxID=34011 RepID=UPI0004026726|nr:acyl-CoA desaturase [Niveispirillum irakense]